MDIPVAVIKLRDYALWFGPAYLLALALGAATEVLFRRLLALPAATLSTGGLLQAAALPALTRMFPSGAVPARLVLWLELVSASTTWLALIMTAALSWPLSLLRIGSALIIAALLAAVVPIFLPMAKNAQPEQSAPPGALAPAALPEVALPRQWWRLFWARFDATNNAAILGVVLGAVVIGLSPRIYSLLTVALQAPASYIWGPVLGSLSWLIPGTDGPLLAAMQARGLESAAIASMLAVSLAPFGLLRRLQRRYSWKLALAYTLAAWLLAGTGAWLLSSAIGTLSF